MNLDSPKEREQAKAYVFGFVILAAIIVGAYIYFTGDDRGSDTAAYVLTTIGVVGMFYFFYLVSKWKEPKMVVTSKEYRGFRLWKMNKYWLEEHPDYQAENDKTVHAIPGETTETGEQLYVEGYFGG